MILRKLGYPGIKSDTSKTILKACRGEWMREMRMA